MTCFPSYSYQSSWSSCARSYRPLIRSRFMANPVIPLKATVNPISNRLGCQIDTGCITTTNSHPLAMVFSSVLSEQKSRSGIHSPRRSQSSSEKRGREDRRRAHQSVLMRGHSSVQRELSHRHVRFGLHISPRSLLGRSHRSQLIKDRPRTKQQP